MKGAVIMTYTNDTFNKITVIKKDGRVGVLTERELLNFHPSKNIKTPVYLGSRVLFTLSYSELREIRDEYKAKCA